MGLIGQAEGKKKAEEKKEVEEKREAEGKRRQREREGTGKEKTGRQIKGGK